MILKSLLSRLLIAVILLSQVHAGTATYNNSVLADTPVAFWTFDETSGTTATDVSGTAQNGIYENCTLSAAAAFPNLGTAVTFNGTNARVRMPFDAAFNLGAGDFSVELWYRTTVTGRGDMFNFKAGAVDFGIFANDAASGSLRGWHNGFLPGPTTANAVPINAWHHVVYVRQSNVISLYIDGAFHSSAADAQSMSASTDIVIGANINAIWFTGQIDEVAYYGTALSAGRVSAHYAAAQATNPNAPLVVTNAATGITSSGATIGGQFTQVGSPDPTVTMYYGTTNGGSVPANWTNSVSLGARNSAFTTNISGLLPATQYFFIARAQNASGDSYGLPGLSFTTANGAPVVANVAATNVFASSATIGGQITATGGLTPTMTIYYGTTDGATTAGAWANNVNLGAQTGTATTQVTGLLPGTQYFFRAFAQNGAGSSWAPATATFTTVSATLPAVQTDAATDVSGFAATMRGTVTDAGNDPPTVRFYYGTTDGGTNAGAWASNAVVSGLQTGAFAQSVAGLAGGTTYFFRAHAQNAAGAVWAVAGQTFTTASAPVRSVVINEVHYHPVELPAFDAGGNPAITLTEEQHEFIELRNTTAAPVVLTGWRLSGGVDFAFPNGTTIAANGYLVIGKNPARLQTVYAGLTGVLGPYTGALKNSGDQVRLRDASDAAADEVSYKRELPWPNSADALGAGDQYTLLSSASYQYKGRSLQRVSANAEGNDAANWLASPVGGAPTPGAANAVSLAVPKPVVTGFSVLQTSDDSPVIRAAQSVRVQVSLSSTSALTSPQVEYFVDVIDGATAYTEPRSTVAMTALGNNQFSATLPGQADRSVVRWRMKANRGNGVEQVFPRTDDAAIVPVGVTTREAWQAYFVQPVRTTTKTAIYDVFVSNSDATSGAFNGLNGLATLNYNITANPKRVTAGDSSGQPRAVPFVAATAQLWNGTVPCIFVVNGEVRDAHIRYHGSRYNRNAGRNSFKMTFPDTQMVNGADSFFVTDKSDYFSVCHGLYINANLPMSEVNWVDWYVNNNGVLTRLQQGEYNGDLLDKYHDRMASLNPGVPKEDNGEFYKDAGIIESEGEGPYAHGSGRRLLQYGAWTPFQRYEWTFALQNNGWKGSKPAMDFFTGLWNARGDTHTAPAPNIANMRAFLDTQLDVDTLLHSLAVANWMCPWDDTTQNHFLWKRANGRWNHMLWDFDAMFGNGDTTSSNSWIYVGENGTPSPASNALGTVLGNNFRGPNWFKDSVFKAYRTEYNNKLWLLNNTYLSPANLQTLFYRNQAGAMVSYYSFINGVKASFCEQRFQSVNIQTGHAADGSDFFRPAKPTHTAPLAGAAILPPASFTTSAYAHSSGNTTGNNAHTRTKWEIRHSAGTYFAPVYTTTSTTSITSLAIPFGELTFGETYFWRVTYLDALEHPSLPSDETAFTFGPQSSAQTFIPFSTSWKYNATTAFTDNSWTQPAFNDTAWASGNAALSQAGEPIPAPAVAGATVAAPGTLSPAGRAYLFRKTFTIPVNPMSITNLRIRHAVDDGCVIWINGNKVHRYFFNEQANYTTAEFTSAGAGPGEAVMQYADAVTNTANWAWVDPRPFLVQGTNTIAVQVHQTGAGSSDVVMALEMTGTVPSTGGEIVLNEVAANPATGPDWIELRNTTGAAVDISGWGLSDDLLNPTRYVFPAATSIAANGFLQVFFDNSAGGTGFGLDSGGQRVVLTSGGTLKDNAAFGPQARGHTISRDGAGVFALTNPTPGAANSAAVTLGGNAGVRINEWQAAPAHGDDWIELYNPDALPVSITGLYVSDAAADPKNTQLPPLSFIAGKGFADLVADGSTDGGNRVNFKLAAGGESIVLTRADGYTTQHSVTFGATATETSRGSLPDGSATLATFTTTVSRGASNWTESGVVVNEALANSVLPIEDFIELRNTTGAGVDVSGWWLSDDKFARQKFVIPNGTTIAAGGTLVVTESQFNAGGAPFSLSSLGDEIILTATSGGVETGLRSQVSFGASADNVSFGRVLTGNPAGSWKPEFWPQTTRTPDAANSASVVTPVIINEIHYHPPDLLGADNVRDEFIELHNPTTLPVSLAGWRLKGGGDFTFPAGTTLRAGDYILIVGFNPADTATLNAFRAALGVSAATPIFGPFSPKLGNDEADVEIAAPIGGGVFVNVDKVRYADFAPWTVNADGNGPSLQRTSRTIIGNDPANWVSFAPMPGAVNTGQTVITDNDGDGMPNTYEDANGLDKFTNDAALDLDGDGQSNGTEYTAGTDPRDPNSRFTAEALPATGGAKVRFTARTGKTYTIQYRNDLTSGTWLKLTDIAAPGADTIIEHTDASGQPKRFYRVATPAQP